MARPPISFDLCKERLYRRLEHHGIEITKVVDEELCYIPMGGAMPSLTQVSDVLSIKSACDAMSWHASGQILAWFGAHRMVFWAALSRSLSLL